MDMNSILEKLRLRRRDEDRAQDADRKDADRREDEERRKASAEAELQKEEAAPRARLAIREEEKRPLPPRPSAPVRDADPDPGWLDRWESEGALRDLTPEERAKLEAMDREDPYGRGQRQMFLPREVLAIRANSERAVEKMRAERAESEAKQELAQEQESGRERPPEPKPAPGAEVEQDQDDDMEMDR